MVREKSEVGFACAPKCQKINFSLKSRIRFKTYETVHMPTAHMSTDGCEALSASLFAQKFEFFRELPNSVREFRKMPEKSDFSRDSLNFA